MPDRIDFEFKFSGAPGSRIDRESPRLILIMGDFSGRSQHDAPASTVKLADRTPVKVDIDSLEAVLARFAPRLTLPMEGSTGIEVELAFRELDDFHPDSLYRRLPVFDKLRQTRRHLLDPASFAQAAAELTEEAAKPEAGERLLPESDETTLQRLLGKGSLSSARTDPRETPVQRSLDPWIRQIVAPYIEPRIDDRQQSLVTAIDETTTAQMRAILHHPAFQALESLWRSVHGLVTHIEFGEDLGLYLLDVTQAELAHAIQVAGADLEKSSLYRLLVERNGGSPDASPWSLMVGNYTFGNHQGDLAVLAAMGAMACRNGGPFIAAAGSELLGCRSLVATPNPLDWKDQAPEASQRWQALRRSPQAPWIGLTLPRVLLRLPYGRRTDPVENFEFEELAPGWDHETLLWGNAAFLGARLLAEAFLEQGQAMRPDHFLDIEDLPAYVFRESDEAVMQPCAEVYLGERAIQAILEQGIIPVVSHRRRNAVHLAGWQSVAISQVGLSGPW